MVGLFNQSNVQSNMPNIPPNMTAAEYLYDARIDDGRLYYDKRW